MDRLKTFINKLKNNSMFYFLVYVRVCYGPLLLFIICYFAMVFVIYSLFPVMPVSPLPINSIQSKDSSDVLNVISVYTKPEIGIMCKEMNVDEKTLITKKALCNLNLTEQMLPEKPGCLSPLMLHGNTSAMTYAYVLQKQPIGNTIGAEHFLNRMIGFTRYLFTDSFSEQLKICEAKSTLKPTYYSHFSFDPRALNKNAMKLRVVLFFNACVQQDITFFVEQNVLEPYSKYSMNYFYEQLALRVSPDTDDIHTSYRCAKISAVDCRREYIAKVYTLLYDKYGYQYDDLIKSVADISDYYFKKYTALAKNLNTSKTDSEWAKLLETKMNAIFSKKPKLKEILFKKI